MTRQEFLAALRSRLSILNDDELDDIIDEYSGYIDSKMAEGKQEAEAVADFGDIDDLSADILDAYKINRDYSQHQNQREEKHNKNHSKSRWFDGRNDRFDFDHLISKLGDVLTESLEYLTRFFQHVLANYSVESITQLLVIIVVAIMVIVVLRIPFWILGGLGNMAIYFIMPFSIARILAVFWNLILSILHIAVALLVVAGIVQAVIDKKDIKLSFKEIFDQTKKSKTNNQKKQRSEKTDDQPMTDNTLNDVNDANNNDSTNESQNHFSHFADSSKNNQKAKQSVVITAMIRVVKVLLAFFILLVLLPFYGGLLSLAVLIGILLYLLTQGVMLFGFLILAIGFMILISVFTGFVWSLLKRRNTSELISFKALLVLSCVMIGFGSVFSFSDAMSFEYVPVSTEMARLGVKKAFIYDLSASSSYRFEYRNSEVSFHEDTSLQDGQVKVIVSYLELGRDLIKLQDEKTTSLYLQNDRNSLRQSKYIFDLVMDGLRSRTIYDSSDDSMLLIKMHANRNTLNKLSNDGHDIVYQP